MGGKNGKSTAMIWPPNVGKDFLDQLYVCELTNHADKAYLNVTLRFNTAFFEVISTGAKVQKKLNKDGTTSFTLPLRATGRNSMTFNDKNGDVKKNGEILKSFYHPIVVPVIGPTQTVKIYLINQSRFVAGFDFPTKAAGLLANGEKIDISLIRPKVTVVDRVSWMLLAPPNYHWRGVPDAP